MATRLILDQIFKVQVLAGQLRRRNPVFRHIYSRKRGGINFDLCRRVLATLERRASTGDAIVGTDGRELSLQFDSQWGEFIPVVV